MQLAQPGHQQLMGGQLQLRVEVDDALRLVAGHLHQLAVGGNVGNLQVEGHAALLRAFQVAGSAQLQVGFGNAEAVVRLAHDVDALARVLRQLIGGDEDAERLVGAAPHTAPQLVQLRESEALGVEDDHDRGVGHVHAHLDDRRGHEHLRLAADEALHLLLLVLGLHLPVHLAQAKLGKGLAQRLEALLQVLQVNLLALLNEGEHHVDLASLLNLAAHAGIERCHV